MKQGQMTGCVAVFIAVFFVTQASVYADHFIAGGGRYSPDNRPQVVVKFQFLGVKSRSDLTVPPFIDTLIQFTIVIPSEDANGSIPLRLFTSGTELEPFMVEPFPPTSSPPDRHNITITGKMLSKLVVGVEPDDQHLTEIVEFEVRAVDEKRSDSDGNRLPESLILTLHYDATQPTASRLADLVTCNAGICTLTLEGRMIDGEIESHTAGDA